MFKRIPVSYFSGFKDVYFSMIDFMQEVGFTIISTNAKHLFDNISTIEEVYVLQDPNTIHKLCLAYYNQTNEVQDPAHPNSSSAKINITKPKIVLFIIDEYDNNANIYNQVGFTRRMSDDDGAVGVGIYDAIYYNRTNLCDLVCIYINKSLIFIYTPLDCYIFSHIFNDADPTGGHILFYGNFTKYHLGYNKDDILSFGIMCGVEYYGQKLDMRIDYSSSVAFYKVMGLVYCNPEATNSRGDNYWFAWTDINKRKYADAPPKYPPPLLTSFDGCSYTDIFGVPNYNGLYKDIAIRHKSMLNNTLSNSSILLPLVVYGMREPKVLNNWSAIGETKLINLTDLSHISSGEMFIDTSYEKDMHKYFVFPAMMDSNSINGNFIGIAVEVWAKENLLYSQSQDYLTINLEDSFRNFDRFEIVYEGNNEVEWTYDDLVAVFDTDGVFNLTKDENNKCMVYGLKNEDGESREYRFTCSESCEIISITGYRE